MRGAGRPGSRCLPIVRRDGRFPGAPFYPTRSWGIGRPQGAQRALGSARTGRVLGT